jgi:VIT1/CCC1 family predicted Fe2+/Mn2+ transporter
VGRAAAQVAALLANLGGHRWRKNVLKMVAIGLGAGVARFLIGRLFHTAGA